MFIIVIPQLKKANTPGMKHIDVTGKGRVLGA